MASPAPIHMMRLPRNASRDSGRSVSAVISSGSGTNGKAIRSRSTHCFRNTTLSDRTSPYVRKLRSVHAASGRAHASHGIGAPGRSPS